MIITLVLTAASWIALSYLIYRYARYSPWRAYAIGRAFMMMKTALWAALTYVLAARLIPPDLVHLRRGLSVSLLLYLLSAIITQIVVIVKLQREGEKAPLDASSRAGSSRRS